ncbi:MAG: metallothionein [Leptolyngbyaceae cyanobacterium]
MVATQTQCACSSCQCTVDTTTAIEKDSQYYCCKACANGHENGSNCGNADCNCPH